MTWTPKPRSDVDPCELPLDVQQAYLLSRLDGVSDAAALAAMLGLEAEVVAAQLADLARMGAIDAEPVSPSQDMAAPEEPSSDESAGESAGEETPEEDPEAEARDATHRQLFETRLHALELNARVAQARQAEEPELSAYCFDPMPQVVAALMENPRTGPMQARLIAAHHRTAAGLEQVGAKAAFAQDGGVRRALLKNPLLPAGLYRRLWSPRRLQEQYLVVASREAPEQTRAMARDTLRAAFNQRSADEKVELILGTEGRCLAFLMGLAIDGHTTALLCRRTYVSTLLIQNIARWSAAPPQLIAHLRKQDAVRRNAQLKLMLERHPNAS